MRHARRSIPRIISLLLALVAAAPAVAQQVTFRGIPLGTPLEQTRARLQALGFRYRGTDQDGDQVYAAPDSSELVVSFDARGAVHFEQRWEGTPAFVRRRSRALDDSLARVYGRRLERGGTRVEVTSNDEPGSRIRAPFVTLAVMDTAALAAADSAGRAAWLRAGAALSDSLARAAGPAADDTLASGETALVGAQGRSSVELDVSRAVRVRPGVYRTRFRAEYWWLMRLPNGMKYDTELWEGELDCVRRTWHTTRVERHSGNRPLPQTPQPDRWTSPLTQPVGQNVARASCAILQTPRPDEERLTLFGVPWGAPRQAVRAAAEARGYRFRGVDQFGTHVFGGAAGAEMLASFDSAGVREIDLRWPGTPAAARRRYDALVDSLRRALGPSRPAEEGGNARSWVGREAELEAGYDDRRRLHGQAVTSLTATSFRHARELARRAEAEAQAAEAESRRRYAENQPVPRDTAVDGEWRYLAGDRDDMVLLDTATIVPAGAGVYRVRIREDWRDTRRLENGLMYTGELRRTEID